MARDPRSDKGTFREYLRTGILINEKEMRLDKPCSLFLKGLDGKTYIICIAADGIFQVLNTEGESIGLPVEQPPNFWVPPTLDIQDWIGNGSQQAINTNIGFHRVFKQSPSDDEMRGQSNLLFGPIEYDGTDIFLRLLWQLDNLIPSSGDTVIWELDFAFVKADGTEDADTKSSGTLSLTIDVGSRSVGNLFSDDLPNMPGLDGASLLEMNLRRKASVDLYKDPVKLFAVVMFRSDTVL